jgi:hypothetical protein
MLLIFFSFPFIFFSLNSNVCFKRKFRKSFQVGVWWVKNAASPFINLAREKKLMKSKVLGGWFQRRHDHWFCKWQQQEMTDLCIVTRKSVTL